MREADCLDFELLAAAAAGDGRTDGQTATVTLDFSPFLPSILPSAAMTNLVLGALLPTFFLLSSF